MDSNTEDEKKADNLASEAQNELSPRQKRAQRREEILDKVFGTYRPASFENIWGNTLPKVGFVLIVGLCIFAYWGTQKGLITWEKEEADLPALFQKKKVQDTLQNPRVDSLSVDNKDTKKD